MRKISLNIDDLSVESFDTASASPRKAGTVRGHETDATAAETDADCATGIDGCNSEYSNCATCLYGCGVNTLTCFASCLMTDGYGMCLQPCL